MTNNCTENINSMAIKVSFEYILGFFNQFYLFLSNNLLNTHRFKPSNARNLQKTFYIRKYSSFQERAVSLFSRSACLLFRKRKFSLSNVTI